MRLLPNTLSAGEHTQEIKWWQSHSKCTSPTCCEESRRSAGLVSTPDLVGLNMPTYLPYICSLSLPIKTLLQFRSQPFSFFSGQGKTASKGFI